MKRVIGTSREILDRRVVFLDTPLNSLAEADGRRNGRVHRLDQPNGLIGGAKNHAFDWEDVALLSSFN